MGTKEDFASFDFEIKSKREDANNGFLDLKLKEIIKNSAVISDWEKNTATVNKLEDFQLDYCLIVNIKAQKTLDKDAWDLGECYMRIDEKAENHDGMKIRTSFWKFTDEEEDDEDRAIIKYGKDCITVRPEDLAFYYINQIITIQVAKTDIEYEESDPAEDAE